jgi:hypothetical protein
MTDALDYSRDERNCARELIVHFAVTALLTVVAAVVVWLLMSRFQRIEGALILDLSPRGPSYHRILETVPAWTVSVVIVSSVAFSWLRLRRAHAEARLIVVSAALHGILWFAFMFFLALVGETAFP